MLAQTEALYLKNPIFKGTLEQVGNAAQAFVISLSASIPERIFTRIFAGDKLTREEMLRIRAFYNVHPTTKIESISDPELRELLRRFQNHIVAPAVWHEFTQHLPDRKQVTLHTLAGAIVALFTTSCGISPVAPTPTPDGPKAWYAPLPTARPQIRETVVPGIGTLKTNRDVPKGDYMYVLAGSITMEQAMVFQNNPSITLVYDITQTGQFVIKGFLLPVAVGLAGVSGNIQAAIEGDDATIYVRDGKAFIRGKEVQAQRVKVDANAITKDSAEGVPQQDRVPQPTRVLTPTSDNDQEVEIYRSKGPPSGQPYFWNGGEIMNVRIYRKNRQIFVDLYVETNGDPSKAYTDVITFEQLPKDLLKVLTPHLK